MIRITDKNKCCGCEACAQICPVSCINMAMDDEGFRYPSIDSDACINCGLCDATCPVLNPVHPTYNVQNCYAAYSLDEEYRANSSSGGLFYELAKAIISKGGLAYGAAYDDQFNVYHKCAGSLVELKSLLGSKYVQSHLGDSFKEVKAYLAEGKEVLFVGTECQIAGLKKFLGNYYENLLTVGIVCHGVPSHKAWKSYLESVEKSDELISVNMRDKTSGWSRYNYSWMFEYKDGTTHILPQNKVSYMTGFVSDYYLRPSCYDCKFKGCERCADITLGDFWGVWDTCPEMDDNLGTSLVLIHTEKGLKTFDSIHENLKYKQVPFEDSTRQNPSLFKSATLTEKRSMFFKRIADGESFENIVSSMHSGQNSTIKAFLKKIKHLTRF